MGHGQRTIEAYSPLIYHGHLGKLKSGMGLHCEWLLSSGLTPSRFNSIAQKIAFCIYWYGLHHAFMQF